MPKKGTYIALIVIGFLLGIIWGVYSLTQYSPMMQAVEAGDSTEAWARAKKIKIATILGVVANIVAYFIMTR